MNILVVGGAGYLGGGLTDLLMQSPHDFLVYDFLLYEESYRKNVPFVFGDIRDYQKLQPYLDWADVVVWLAGIVGDPACALDESLTVSVNSTAVEYLRDHFRGRIIYMSSASVYGAGNEILYEHSELRPLSLYARGKLEAEQILSGGNCLIFRLATLFGLSDRFSRVRFDLVVNILVMRAILHGTMTVFGGEQYRPLLHVRDAANAIFSALDQEQTGIYNLHFENYTILEIAERVRHYFQDVRIQVTDLAFQDNRNYRVSSEKARRELDFSPQYSLDEGIQEMQALLQENRIKNTFLSRYSNYTYLRSLTEKHSSPLGRELKAEV